MWEIKNIRYIFTAETLKTWLAFFILCIIAYFMGVAQVVSDTLYPQYNFVLVDIVHNLHRAPNYIADICLGLTLLIHLVYFFVFYNSEGGIPLHLIYRRLFWILAILYAFRGITLSVTRFPVTRPECQLRQATSTGDIFYKAVEIIAGRTTCTDLLFSGHTFMMLISIYSIDTYGRFRYKWAVLGFLYSFFIMSVFFVITGRLHYTVDTIVSILVAYGIYNNYHAIINYGRQEQDVLLNPRQNQVVLWYPSTLKIVHWMDSSKFRI